MTAKKKISLNGPSKNNGKRGPPAQLQQQKTTAKYTKEPKWDYDLLADLSQIIKPNMPEEYYTKESITSHRNGAAANIQKYVKILLEELPPKTFVNTNCLMEIENEHK